MIHNGVLDESNSTTFKFPSNGAGNATKPALFFCLEDMVSLSGVKSFDEAESGLIVSFLAILCSSIAKAGVDGSDFEVLSRFINMSSFLSTLPTLRLDCCYHVVFTCPLIS